MQYYIILFANQLWWVDRRYFFTVREHVFFNYFHFLDFAEEKSSYFHSSGHAEGYFKLVVIIINKAVVEVLRKKHLIPNCLCQVLLFFQTHKSVIIWEASCFILSVVWELNSCSRDVSFSFKLNFSLMQNLLKDLPECQVRVINLRILKHFLF